jgi:hypothetical protein
MNRERERLPAATEGRPNGQIRPAVASRGRWPQQAGQRPDQAVAVCKAATDGLIWPFGRPSVAVFTAAKSGRRVHSPSLGSSSPLPLLVLIYRNLISGSLPLSIHLSLPPLVSSTGPQQAGHDLIWQRLNLASGIPTKASGGGVRRWEVGIVYV